MWGTEMEKKVVTPETIKQAGALIVRMRDENAELEKVASASVLEKRAQKIAFREVELGIAEPFKSHQEFQEKIASLLAEGDLDVVEKALDRGYATSRRDGTLDGSVVKELNVFEHFVRTGELSNG